MVERVPKASKEGALPIPEDVTADYLSGALYTKYSAFDTVGTTKYVRPVNREEYLESIDKKVLFQIEFRKDTSDPNSITYYDNESVDFNYSMKERGDVGQIGLRINDRGRFDVWHREIAGDYQAQGIGTRLFEHVLEWVQQVANTRKAPVVISAGVSQLLVLKWFKKLGFEPVAADRELFDDVLNHPEKYQFEDQSQGERKMYIYEKSADTLRDPAVRITMELMVQPRH